ncbi:MULTISPECIES: hypothetical protein [Paraliobacillus]|uniref:hypothetical protein n=1 Tax=Paraliobacillus TaxID=200903 RepID=UPI000E3B78D5|nr:MULTISPECIES: hypothetical protein [Paraliobacillus]
MKVGLVCGFLLVYFMQPTILQAAHEDEQQSENHIWEIQKVSYHDVPIYSHEFNVWHHFIEKEKTCSVVNKVKTEVRYCKVHDHIETKVTSQEVTHSHDH